MLCIVPGIIGCLQALEAIKIASSIGTPLSGRMLLFDALSGHIRIVSLFHCILLSVHFTIEYSYWISFNYYFSKIFLND